MVNKYAIFMFVFLLVYAARAAVTTTGGTVTYWSGYKVHTFYSSGSFVVSGGSIVANYYVVAGGGGGCGGVWTGSGYRAGGGGGAGGYVYSEAGAFPISEGTTIITVGSGGTGGTGGPTGYRGSNGGNSSIGSSITAVGGGGGGGLSGGSGGGGSYGTYGTGGSGTSPQGHNGGDYGAYYGFYQAGGGGGFGSDGHDGNEAWYMGYGGSGGTVTPLSLSCAGGGGGGYESSSVGGTPGAGGGRGGGNSVAAASGTANTGGGGGGAGSSLTYKNGGAGGSGIVVIVVINTYPSPGKASVPSPANSAVNVLTNAQFSWTAGSYATSYKIYASILPASLSYLGSTSGTTYNPGALTHRTNYQWRVDSVNGVGTTTGDTWGFTTTNNKPKAATTPSPADDATGVATNATLTWVDGGFIHSVATNFTVWFGPSGAMANKGLSGGTSYTPSGMALDTEYDWKIVSMNENDTTGGYTWSFRTLCPTPLPPVNPSPPNYAYSQPTNSTFSWDDGGSGVYAATNYQVFVEGISAGYTNATAFDPGGLDEFSTYTWYVVAYNAYGSATSVVWTFHTTGQTVLRKVCGAAAAKTVYEVPKTYRIWGE